MAEITQEVENSKADTPQPRKREPRVQVSQPVFHQTLSVNSLQAQRVMNRSFNAAAGSLFRIDVILRIIGDESNVDEVEGIIMDYIKTVRHDLEKELSASKALLESNGIDNMPTYSMPVEFKIEIKSPQIANFARLVMLLDQLMAHIDTLWLNGSTLTSKHRARTTYQWQQRLIRLAGRIIAIEKRARYAAYNAGKKEAVELAAPISEHEADEQTVTAETEAIDQEAAGAKVMEPA
ncbi:hypothetical protein [Eoetvoesiella caeni]